MAIDYRKKDKWQDGYYLAIIKLSGEMQKKNPKLDGNVAYDLAKNKIDEQIALENPQQQLTLA